MEGEVAQNNHRIEWWPSNSIWMPAASGVSFMKFAVLLFLAASFGIPRSMIAADASQALLPMPREYTAGDVVSLDNGVSISAGTDSEDQFAAKDLAEWLETLNVPEARGHSSVPVELLRTPSRRAEKLLSQSGITIDASMHEEGYAIVKTEKGLAVI